MMRDSCDGQTKVSMQTVCFSTSNGIIGMFVPSLQVMHFPFDSYALLTNNANLSILMREIEMKIESERKSERDEKVQRTTLYITH